MVASLLAWHEHHARALAVLERAVERGDVLVLPGHVLVEAYAVLTRLPSRHQVAPAVAYELLRAGFRERARIVTLSGREVWSVLDASGRTGVAGGLTQGARILAAAKKAGAEVLLTFDVRDYQRLELGGLRVESP